MVFRCVWESCSYHKNSKNTKASSPFQIASIICSNQRKINLVRVVTSINHSKLSAYLPPHPILNWWVKHQSTFWTKEKAFIFYTNKILPRNQTGFLNEKNPFFERGLKFPLLNFFWVPLWHSIMLNAPFLKWWCSLFLFEMHALPFPPPLLLNPIMGDLLEVQAS